MVVILNFRLQTSDFRRQTSDVRLEAKGPKTKDIRQKTGASLAKGTALFVKIRVIRGFSSFQSPVRSEELTVEIFLNPQLRLQTADFRLQMSDLCHLQPQRRNANDQ